MIVKSTENRRIHNDLAGAATTVAVLVTAAVVIILPSGLSLEVS